MDTKSNYTLTFKQTHKRRYLLMSTSKTGTQYDKDLKHTLINLYQSGSKSQTALCKEYSVSITALGRWIKQYSTVKTDENEVLTAKQVKELQKRNAQLEEELLILDYAAIYAAMCSFLTQTYR